MILSLTSEKQITRPPAGDLALALKAAAGDDRAFGDLVARYQGPLRGFLMRLTGNTAEADDLAQDTFIKAHRNLKAFEGRSAFKTWLFSIAYREFLGLRRKAARRDALSENKIEVQDTAPAHDGGLSTDMERAMAQLRPEERAAMMLSYVYGMSHGEVSDALDLPLGTVKSHINRGKAALRTLLAAYAKA